MNPTLAGNNPFGQFMGARFFKATVEYANTSSTCVKVAADTEGEARASLVQLVPKVAANVRNITKINIRECGRFEAVMIRGINHGEQ